MWYYKVTKPVTIMVLRQTLLGAPTTFALLCPHVHTLLQPPSFPVCWRPGCFTGAKPGPLLVSLVFSYAVPLERDSCYPVLCMEPHGAPSRPCCFYVDPHSTFDDVSQVCHETLGRGNSAIPMNSDDSVHHCISTAVGRGHNVQLSLWALHDRFRFHHVGGLHFIKVIYVCAHTCTPVYMSLYMYGGQRTT